MTEFIIEVGQFIAENVIEVIVGIGTIIAIIKSRGKNLDELKRKKEKKLEKQKAINKVTAEALKKGIAEQERLEKEINQWKYKLTKTKKQ